MDGRYDVIIVGARCAGASLAALLARRGLSIVVLDRDRLPSDQVLSTHTIHPPGLDVLDEIGVGDAVRRGCPPSPRLRLGKNDASIVLRFDEGRADFCPRRHRLDGLLQQAAADAGAAVIDGCRVTSLIYEDGRVAGVRAVRDGAELEFRAPLVVGADGRHSTIAKLVEAEEYLGYDAPRAMYWSYWDAPPVWHDESRYPFDLYVANRHGAARVVFQTDDERLLIGGVPPVEEARGWRASPLAALTAYLAKDPVTAPLVADRAPAEPVRGTISERYYFRRAAGPGWVLVGDAGHHKDFLIGDGITEALLQVRTLVPAILAGTDAALERWWRERDVRALPIFCFAADEGAAVPPKFLQTVVFDKVARDASLQRRMVDVMEHAVSPYDVFRLPEIVKWTLTTALKGRPQVIPEFLAMGKRAAEVSRELASRKALLVAVLLAVFTFGAAVAPARAQTAPADTSGFVDADGARILVRTVGAGTPLVVVHGGPGLSHDYLAPQLIDLLAADYKLVFYDQRASGRSTGVSDLTRLTMGQFVEDVEAVRRSLGIERINLLGHSFGGLLAMYYAAAHPERVERLVLLDTSPASWELNFPHFRRAIAERQTEADRLEMAQLMAVENARSSPEVMDRYYKLYFRTFFKDPRLSEQIHLGVTPEWLANNAVTNDRIWSDLGRYDIHDDLARITAPTLIIHGRASVISVEGVEAIHARIPRSQIILLDDVGHFPYIESPQAFMAAVKAFVW